MRIAQIVPSLEASQGGPSRSVLGLSEGLARAGHEVELLTTASDADPGPPSGRLTIRTFPRQWPGTLARSPALRRHLDAHRHDIVHHHGLWLRTLHYAHAAAARTGAPLVISPRGMMSPWAWRHRRWKKLPASWLVHRGAFPAARGWHATSAEEADDIRRLGFKQPVCIAPNGVVPPSPADEAAAAERWLGLLPSLAGRRVALFYSRFHAKKRLLELIDLWLAAPRDDWTLLIVGIPEQYTVGQLDSYLVRNGGIGRILVHDGAGEPPPYAVASLFLLPSHSENFGLVIAEALVRGVPALVTDATPWSGLDSAGAGRCVSWENYASTLRALLAEPPESLRASGERARAWALPTFAWDRSAALLASFYERLLNAT